LVQPVIIDTILEIRSGNHATREIEIFIKFVKQPKKLSMNKFAQIMQDKRGPVIMLFSAIVGVLVGYTMSHLSQFGICPNEYNFGGHTKCGDSIFFPSGVVILYVSLGLSATSVIFFFVYNEVFRSWLKWAGAFVVISFLLSLIREVYVFNVYTMAKDFSIIFFFLSFVFILWQAFGIRDRKTKE
jgi:hypothetical protein